jgi:3-hydroxyacyl-[acyl-carrier-protein] dehydratase
MKFEFIDAIVEFVPGERIVAVKAVTLAEEYLADHFPSFPVLPGVLMLQTLVEAATWLVREAEDFASSLILLREARNVTYKSFVKPGNLLRVEVSCRRMGEGESDFEGVGYSRANDEEVVRARFGLRHISLRGTSEPMDSLDGRIIEHARARWKALRGVARES